MSQSPDDSYIQIRCNEPDLIEKRELFIHGFMQINNVNNLRCIAYSILHSLMPSLTQSDISGVRFVPPHSGGRGTSSNYNSFVITLKTPEIVQAVMRAKKSFNYFSTKDINLQCLNSEVAIAVPDNKMFINEVLSATHRLQYISVKETAKRLGFKYVWHNNGDFLIRWKNGMRSHAIRTVSDLHTILELQNIPTHQYKSPQINLATHQQQKARRVSNTPI